MATKKIKFPKYSHSEMLKLIYESGATREVRIDDVNAIDRGRFVLAWDSDNAADDYPVVGALRSVTMKRHGEMSYDVLSEGGYHTDYRHARIIDAASLPFVVGSSDGPCQCECVGKIVGFCSDTNDAALVTVTDREGSIFFFVPEHVAYLDDVKFGIVTEDHNDDGN